MKRILLSLVLGSSPGAIKAQTFQSTLQALETGEVAPCHALLIQQRGELLLERYWSGEDGWRGKRTFDADALHDLRSCSKSVVGLLVGIAVDKGLLPTPSQTLAHSLFKDLSVDFSEEHRRITMGHLLLMTDGLAWNQNTSDASANNEAQLERSKDTVAYVWSRPIANPPGKVFNYNSGATTLLAGAVQRAAGMDIEAYAAKALFEPLGITRWEWMRDNDGLPGAHYGLRLRPRDMLKIGQLILNRGEWEGKRIVSEAWINALSDRQKGQRGYGYQWWLDNRTISGVKVELIDAAGKGGQMIHVLPVFDAVIVVTAGHYEDSAAASSWFTLLKEHILPSLLAGSKIENNDSGDQAPDTP